MILVGAIIFISMIGLSSADLGTFKQGECVSIRVIGNYSYVNLTEITNNQQTYIINDEMTLLGGQTFNYSFCNTNITGLYSYSWNPNGIDCSEKGCGNSFMITNNGLNPAGDPLTIFIYLIFIFSFILSFYSFFINLVRIAIASQTIYNVLTSIGSFILIIFSHYLAKEYLLSRFIEDITGTLIQVTAWTNVVLPLIAFVITIFVKGTQKKRPMSIQEMSGREFS
jgi:hypothetical protein